MTTIAENFLEPVTKASLLGKVFDVLRRKVKAASKATQNDICCKSWLHMVVAHFKEQMTTGKKYRKAVRWCASLNRSLYWLIRFIWIGLLDFWVDWIDLVYLIDWLNGWIQYIICPKSYISYLILVGLIKYLMVESFMRYLIEVGLIKYLTIEFLWDVFDWSWSD